MDDSIKIEYLDGDGCSYIFYDVAYPDVELGQLNLIREHSTVVNKDGVEIYIVAYDIDNLMQAIKRNPPTCLRVIRFVKMLETTGKNIDEKKSISFQSTTSKASQIVEKMIFSLERFTCIAQN